MNTPVQGILQYPVACLLVFKGYPEFILIRIDSFADDGKVFN